MAIELHAVACLRGAISQRDERQLCIRPSHGSSTRTAVVGHPSMSAAPQWPGLPARDDAAGGDSWLPVLPSEVGREAGSDFDAHTLSSSVNLDHCTAPAAGTAGTWESGTHGLSPGGTIGDEHRAMKTSLLQRKSQSQPSSSPHRPPSETFNIIVVGEAGLGKTTLLSSFFKPLLASRPELSEAADKLVHQLNSLGSHARALEQKSKQALDMNEFATVTDCRDKLKRLEEDIVKKQDELKKQQAEDQAREDAPRKLDEVAASSARKREIAAKEQELAVAKTHKVADLTRLEHLMRQINLLTAKRDQTRAVLPISQTSEEPMESTVRINEFNPFDIQITKDHLLQVALIDTPGYGESTNTEESFDVICNFVESRFLKQLEADYPSEVRDKHTMEKRDPLVHVCLYFIAPHRLKGIDIAFMRRLHKLVTIVPLIAKADTMTNKETQAFKKQVCDKLENEGIELYAFDDESVSRLSAKHGKDYTPPWAVIGSTDASGNREYIHGTAESSNVMHSDLPALRDLILEPGSDKGWQHTLSNARGRVSRGGLSKGATNRGGLQGNLTKVNPHQVKPNPLQSPFPPSWLGLGLDSNGVNDVGQGHPRRLYPSQMLRIVNLPAEASLPAPGLASQLFSNLMVKAAGFDKTSEMCQLKQTIMHKLLCTLAQE